MAPKKVMWVQKAQKIVTKHPGALHRQLGYPVEQPIPPAALQKAAHEGTVGKTKVHGHTITPLMRRRANFALNVRHRKK